MQLLIIVYHYINPHKYQAGIYPVSPETFRFQLERLGKEYRFISQSELIDAIEKKIELPEKTCLITFDDGLKCQFDHAVPILEKMGIPAIFFTPTSHLENKKAYNIHQLHYILSKLKPEDLYVSVSEKYKEIAGKELDWERLDLNRIKNWYIYDDLTTAKVKYMLNHTLEPGKADDITRSLFNEILIGGEQKFISDFYFSEKEIGYLRNSELFALGLHTHNHLDIAKLSANFTAKEIEKNLEVLKNIIKKDIFGISYPYGALSREQFDSKVAPVASALGMKYGMTTRKDINHDFSEPFLLNRYNPNDIMK